MTKEKEIMFLLHDAAKYLQALQDGTFEDKQWLRVGDWLNDYYDLVDPDR